MGPLALLGLMGGGLGLASIMKKRGFDLKGKKPSKEQKKELVKKILKKKKFVRPWKTETKEEEKKRIQRSRKTNEKIKKGFLDSIERMF
jgi:hypothetical protein